MKFRKYWHSLDYEHKVAFAKRTECSVSMLYMVARGAARPGRHLARAISKAARIPLHELRPDLWHR